VVSSRPGLPPRHCGAGRRSGIRLQYEKLENVGDPDQTGEGDVDVVDLALVIRL
jgi:hypothetical protein